MKKRLLFVAIAVAAILVVAAPASAFDGYREDFTPTAQCQMCHSVEAGFPGIPAVYEDWQMTDHGRNVQTSAIARGSGCAGCHVSNYAPAKHVPAVAGGPYPADVTDGDDAFSEVGVGCSSCHRNVSTAHAAPDGALANADVCGQCHARYSTTVASYDAWTWPVAEPAPVPTSVMPQHTLGDFNPLGTPGAANDPWVDAAPLADFLTIPTVAAPQRARMWPTGQSASGHGEGAGQYNEWSNEGHAGALDGLKAMGQGNNPACLECHSTDYVLATEDGASGADAAAGAKYGVTCVGCHDPHKTGTQSAAWNEHKNPQLRLPRQQLCVQCHNAELTPQADGSPGIAKPGTDVHHPMNEMMNGTGAIDVPQGSPSVHKGKCVECHMVPTGYEHDGAAGTASNHLFAIIEPEQAKSTTIDLGANGIKPMPYSSCTTCHSRPSDNEATYLQDLLDFRHETMDRWNAQVTEALAAAATVFGYTGADDAALIEAANTAINAKAMTTWTANEMAFQKAYTNQQFVQSEGSNGIHNWEYARTVVLKALEQARSVQTSPLTVTLTLSSSHVGLNDVVTFSGTAKTAIGIPGAGLVTVQKRHASGGEWTDWRTSTLNASGAYAVAVKMTSAPRDWQFRTRMPGANLTAYSAVADLRVDARWVVAFKASRTSVHRYDKVRFSGTVKTASGLRGSGVVRIQKRWAGDSWSTWRNVTLSATGNFAKTVKLNRKGTVYWRAVMPADTDNLQTISKQVRIIVR